MRATMTTNRTSAGKYSRVPKFFTKPELHAAQIVAKLQREGNYIVSFYTNEPLFLCLDENGRSVYAVPDIAILTTRRGVIVRIQGAKWHPEGDEDDALQKKRIEALGCVVLDWRIDGHEDWGKFEAELRKVCTT